MSVFDLISVWCWPFMHFQSSAIAETTNTKTILVLVFDFYGEKKKTFSYYYAKENQWQIWKQRKTSSTDMMTTRPTGGNCYEWRIGQTNCPESYRNCTVFIFENMRKILHQIFIYFKYPEYREKEAIFFFNTNP